MANHPYNERVKKMLGIDTAAQTTQPTMPGYSEHLAKALQETYQYAKQSEQNRQEVANTILGGGSMTALKPGDVQTFDWDKQKQAELDRVKSTKYFRDMGLFDAMDYATNKGYTHLASLSYLNNLLPTLQAEIEASQQKDLDMDALKQQTAETSARWFDLMNADNETEMDRWYNMLMADYLLGDRNELFDFEAIDARYGEMSDEEYEREYQRLTDQWNNLDWETLTGGGSNNYQSKTSELQGYYDTVSGEVTRRTEMEALQGSIRSAADYGTLSAYNDTYVAPEKGTLGYIFSNEPFINGYDDQSRFMNAGASWAEKNLAAEYSASVQGYLDKGYDYLTADELADYNYLINAGRTEDAARYLELLGPELLYRRAMVLKEYQTVKATNPWLAVPTWVDAGIQQIVNVFNLPVQIYEAATGTDNPYSAAWDAYNKSQWTSEAQLGAINDAEIPDWADKALSLAYKGASGARDNFARLVATGFNPTGALILAGAQSGSGSLYESSQRDDMSGAAKIIKAIGTAAIEVGTEKIGLDALFDRGQKGALEYIRSAMLSEVGEETLNAVSEPVLEAVVAYLFDHEAEIMSGPEFWENLTDTAITTAISSLFLSGGTAITQDVETRKRGANLQKNGDLQRTLGIALEMGEGTESTRIAQELQGKLDKKKKLSTYDMGRLTAAIEADTSVELAEAPNQVMEEAIQERLVELGENAGNAKKLAPLIRKVYRGQDVSRGEIRQVNWSGNAEQVVKELTRETTEADAGRVGVDWAQNTKAKATEATGKVMAKAVERGQAVGQIRRVEGAEQTETRAQAVDKAVQKGAAKVKVTKGTKAPATTSVKVAYDDGNGVKEGTAARFVEKDGEVKLEVKTEDGSATVTMDDIKSAEGSGIAAIAAYVEDANAGAEGTHQMSAQEASTMLQVYQTEGGDVGTFIREFEDAYLAGYAGTALVKGAISTQAAQIAYEQGKAEAKVDEEKRVARATSARAASKGAVAWLGKVTSNSMVKGTGDEEALSGAMESMTESQRTTVEVVKAFASTFKTNVVLFESDEQTISHVQNGSFDQLSNTLYIDVNAGAYTTEQVQEMREQGTLGYAMMKVLGHEVTHYLESNSAEGYAKYKAAVKQELQNADRDWAQLVRGKIDAARMEGRKMTYAGAEAEVVADASEYMLQSGKFVQQIEKGVRGAVKRIVQNFMQKLQDVFSKLSGGSKESNALRKLYDGVYKYTGNLQELWDAAMEETLAKPEAAEQGGEATEMVEETEASVKYSPRIDNDQNKTTIKQQIASVAQDLNAMYIVADVTAPNISKWPDRKKKEWAMETLKNSGYKIDVQAFGIVEVGKNQIETSLTYLDEPGELAAFACIPRVLKRGVRINGHENHKGRKFETVTFAAPVKINGVRGNMAVVVKKLDRNLYKTHRILMPDGAAFEFSEQQKTEVGLLDGIPHKEAQGQDTNSVNYIVQQSADSVNGNIQLSSRTQTESEAFKRWFGNSKVVNEDGTPKVMYHGTATEFWTFEKRKANDALGRRMGLGAGKGKFYLSEYEGVGRAAADSAKSLGKGNTPKVMELYVSAQKVMERNEYDRRLAEMFKKYPGSAPSSAAYDYKARDKAITEVDKQIRKEGYDGVWDRDSGEMFVYESTQIKSATDNVGTFDPENSDIRYSLRTPTDTLTIREYLGEMKPTARMNETEKILLKRYQEQLKILREKEQLVAEQEEIIRTAPVPSDELTMAKNRYKIYRAQANRAARALSDAERNDGFARLMATSQEVVNNYLLGSAGDVADAADELDAEVAELTRQLKAVEADVTRSAQGQRTAFARGLFDQKTLTAAAQKLKDTYGSRMAVKTIADRLALVYGEIYANDGPEGAKRFAEAAHELAYDILAGHKYRYKSEILPMLAEKVGVISLTETDLQEIRNAGLTLSEYKRAVIPYIKVADSGSDLASYASNAEYYGDGTLAAILGDDTEGNLAMNLYNVIQREKAQEQEIGVEGMSEGEMVTAVMADIAGSDLPLSTNSKTAEYLRSELKKYAGESTLAAQNIEQAIMNAKKATSKATAVWRAAVKEVDTAKAAVEYYRKLEDQRRLTELKELKQSITEELKTETAKKLVEKVEAQRKEYREREQKARAYRRTRDEVDKLRRKIGRDVKRLNTMRVRETDQKHVPQELQHVADAVMRTFTDSALSKLAFSAEKTASLQRTYQILGEMEKGTAHFWDDEIIVKLFNLASLSEAYNAIRNREAGAPSRLSLEGVEIEMTILQEIDDIVSNVLNMIDTANRNFLTGRQETFEGYANRTGEKLASRDDFKVRKGWLGKLQTMLDETLRTGNVTPVYFFEHLDNPEILQVYDEVRKGQSRYARIVAEGKAYVEETKNRYNYGAWVADGKLQMKTHKGHTIELTREEAAELYAVYKREQANKLYRTEHLLKGGFQFRNIAEKGAGPYRATDKPHQLDAADMARIGAWLTEEQKAYADALVGYLSSNMADYGNAASMDMYGYKKFTESYYIPFKTAANQRYQRGDEGPQGENAGTGRLKNSGFTHKVQHKANQTLVIGGITDTVADHIHKMAAYAAMVKPIEDMKRLLNHKVVEEDGTANTIRALIGQKYGKASEDYLTQLLKDLNGATQSDNRASALTDRLIGAFKRGAVLASASVMLQQPTAMARAMAYISPKYFTQNPFYRPSKGTWNEMMKYAGTAVIKDMGKFDVGLGLTATEYITDENLKVMETYHRLKADSKTKAGKAAYDRFMEKMTSAPGLADQWTWGLIWKAVKAEQAAEHPGMDVNSEAFLQMCGARFDDVIDHTQVYDSVLTRSNLMRSSNALHKMATSFMAEPTLSLNMLYDALTGKHKGTQRAAIIGSVVASQVLAGAMAALVQAFNDDDDKRNWAEKYAGRAWGNILDNLNPLGMIPYVSDIVSLFQGYDVERPDMTVIADLMDYTKTFLKAFEDGGVPTWKQWENFAGTWANLAGVQLKNMSREVRRLRNAVLNTDWSAPTGFNVVQAMLENVPGYDAKNKAYYDRIVAAELDGDVQRAEDYREYLLMSKTVSEDALKTGLKKAMQERYIAGDADADVAMAYLQKIGASEDENDAYWEVDKWQYMQETGNAAGDYRKYDAFFQAVETGDNLKATIKEYLDNGVSKTTLATQITNQYKQQLIDLKKSGKGYADLQARILTAYEALGYDREKKLKDIQKWFE